MVTTTKNATTRRPQVVAFTTAQAAFGSTSGHRLSDVGIPADRCDTAAATCHFDVMGWRKGNHDGDAPRNDEPHAMSGRWVHTSLATYRAMPGLNPGLWRSGTTDRAKYIHADNFEAADQILGCFGLTMEQVIDWATDGSGIQPDDRIRLSLCEIVTALCPAIIAEDALSSNTPS